MIKVASLTWNHEGTRLLTAGQRLQMWKYTEKATADKFELGDADDGTWRGGDWECIWQVRPANPVFYLAFSSDGTLFATAGQHDRLVRIWYQVLYCIVKIGQ